MLNYSKPEQGTIAKETTKRTDERGAGGRWVGRHRLTMTDDEDRSFGSLWSSAGLEDEPFRRVLRARPATAGGSWLTAG